MIGDYLSIIRRRGLPIVLRKNIGIEIVYSREHSFLEMNLCDICSHTKCKHEKKMRMVRILDPDYPEGLLSINTFGVMWKCKCTESEKKSKPKFRPRSRMKNAEPIKTMLPYKDEEIPF